MDSVTKKCAGSSKECRSAMLGILGTDLRTTCACKGSDMTQLHECLGWQRLLWVNPCVGKIPERRTCAAWPFGVLIRPLLGLLVVEIYRMACFQGRSAGGGLSFTQLKWVIFILSSCFTLISFMYLKKTIIGKYKRYIRQCCRLSG